LDQTFATWYRDHLRLFVHCECSQFNMLKYEQYVMDDGLNIMG